MSTVARETELPLSSVQRSLSPNGPPPGRGIIDLLARWFDQQQINAPPKPARAGNGVAAAPPANRLTETEAAELADYLEDASDREIRDELLMSRQLAQQAAARKDLAPEALARLQRFLGTAEADRTF